VTPATKILSVVGARPQFIKAAPVSKAIAASPGLTEVVVHTGQHFDAAMSDVFFEELGMDKPRHHLGINGGRHGDMTGRMLSAIETVFVEESPDLVLVYGDTNSTLAGALAAAKLNVKVAHVEAGLRSFNRRMPEEVNRVLTDHVSAILFCPTSAAVANLRAEGITGGVHLVGDVMYDATLDVAERARADSTIVERLGLARGDYALATVHRAENTDSRASLARVIDYLRGRAAEMKVVLAIHPRTQAAAERFGISLDGVMVIPPVGYLDMACLLGSSREVLTDSGGVQKEAYFHRKPCVTLRGETEWVETIDAGWNRLWSQPGFREPRREIDEYGCGDAAQKIVAALAGNAMGVAVDEPQVRA
jgi:UDP-GlcNAc3NAcA epimerase